VAAIAGRSRQQAKLASEALRRDDEDRLAQRDALRCRTRLGARPARAASLRARRGLEDLHVLERQLRPAGRARTRLTGHEDVEVLAAAPGGAGRAETPSVAASLRVTLRQAVYLAAAQSFARELRLLPRAAGDRRRAGGRLAYGGGLG